MKNVFTITAIIYVPIHEIDCDRIVNLIWSVDMYGDNLQFSTSKLQWNFLSDLRIHDSDLNIIRNSSYFSDHYLQSHAKREWSFK